VIKFLPFGNNIICTENVFCAIKYLPFLITIKKITPIANKIYVTINLVFSEKGLYQYQIRGIVHKLSAKIGKPVIMIFSAALSKILLQYSFISNYLPFNFLSITYYLIICNVWQSVCQEFLQKNKNGGTIKVLTFTYDGNNARDTLAGSDVFSLN
jgi:hypothetical protein